MIRYISKIEDNEDYYINNNYDPKSISNLLGDVMKATEILKNYEQRLFEQFNKATQTVEYHKIHAERTQNQFSSDKKVYITISLRKYLKFEGKEVSDVLVYGKCKQFGYREMEDAIKYIKVLLNNYAGSSYINNTPYKRMNL